MFIMSSLDVDLLDPTVRRQKRLALKIIHDDAVSTNADLTRPSVFVVIPVSRVKSTSKVETPRIVVVIIIIVIGVEIVSPAVTVVRCSERIRNQFQIPITVIA